jgi:hypothetical protein
MTIPEFMVSVHDTEAVCGVAALSVTVTVTENVPVAVGVPLTVPVAESTERPAGSPVAEYLSAGAPPEADTVAV